MTDPTYVYAVETSGRLRVHLSLPDPTTTSTLCGLPMSRLVLGDETVSALACNCRACRASFTARSVTP